MKKTLLALGLVLAPGVALAATCNSAQGTLGGVLCIISGLVAAIVPVLIALGLLLFIWGVIMYVVAGDEEAKSKGRDKMIYGLIGLAVIVGVWGLVNILTKTFGVDNPSQVVPPSIPVLQ